MIEFIMKLLENESEAAAVKKLFRKIAIASEQ